MYVGENKLDKVAAFFAGYNTAFWLTSLETEISDTTQEQWSFESASFSIWLCEECFAATFGEAVGSVAGWANFLIWLADDDAEAFVFLPILYHEFADAVRDAGGSRALRDRLKAVELTLEERWALSAQDALHTEEENDENEEDEEDNWEAEREARKNALRAAARPSMQKAVDDATKGIDRPLASHIAKIRAARAEHKAQAAAALCVLQNSS